MIDSPWLVFTPITFASSRVRVSAPDFYVTVCVDDEPTTLIGIEVHDEDCRCFNEAIFWSGLVVVGYGERVYVASLGGEIKKERHLGSYFGQLYPYEQFVLVASAERVLAIGPDGDVLWESEQVGIDGVVVHALESGVISGCGEWDPPGGWRSFRLRAADGKPLC